MKSISKITLAFALMAVTSSLSLSAMTLETEKMDEAIAQITTDGNNITELDLSIKQPSVVFYNQWPVNGDFEKEYTNLMGALMHPECRVKSLDISYRAIDSKGIKQIGINLNKTKLVRLKISGLHKLQSRGDSGLHKLQSLYMDYTDMGYLTTYLNDPTCKLIELDLSNISGALDKLILPEKSKLKSLNLNHTLIKKLKFPNGCDLESLDLSNCGINFNFIWYMLTEKDSDKKYKIKYLNLSSNWLDDKCAEEIAKALKNPDYKIKNLDLSNNEIGNKGATAIIKALFNNSIIRRVDLTNNNIDRKDQYPDDSKELNDILEELANSNNKIKLIDLDDQKNGLLFEDIEKTGGLFFEEFLNFEFDED